jgi:chromosome segregation ATPase
MQNAREKSLIDIYFDEAKMNVWKEKCIKSSEFINEKILSKNDVILSEKNKIRNEKNDNIHSLRYDWNNITSEYEKLAAEKENNSLSLLTIVTDDIKKYHKCYTSLAEYLYDNNLTISSSSTSYSSIEDCIEFIKQMRSKVTNSSYKDLIYSMTLNTSWIEDFMKKMKALLSKSSTRINVVFSNFHQIKKNLLEVIEKINKYASGFPQIEKDFAYLTNPSYFPQAYHASIIEIKRRIIFNKKLNKDIDRLKQLINKENYNRKQFIQDYGKYLTHDYIPQLKFTELKLSIEYFNNEELQNLPNLLDDEEETAINNNNLVLEYDESSVSDNLIYKNNNMSNRKGSEDRKDESLDTIRKLNTRIEELELSLRTKESHIKSVLGKLDLKDRKITTIQSDMEKLAATVESMTESFSKQVSYLNQKIKEKHTECDNLQKVINSQTYGKLDNCPMCKDIATNNIEFSGWSNYVKEYYEKSNEKNKQLSKLESRFQEIVSHIVLIKRTFFNHLHNTIDLKNIELSNLKQSYEGKLMTMEDLLVKRDNREDEEMNKKNSNLEIKIKDLNRVIDNDQVEIKRYKNERDQLRKCLEDMKFKEGNLVLEAKDKDKSIDKLSNEVKMLEKQVETHKKTFHQLSEEMLLRVKEITNLKCTLDNKVKIIHDLEKNLDTSKVNQSEILKEVNKSHQQSLEELNNKLDRLTKEHNEKTRIIEDYKFKNQELTVQLERKIEEIKHLKDNFHKEQNENLTREALKTKIEELTGILNDKEKKINVNKL